MQLMCSVWGILKVMQVSKLKIVSLKIECDPANNFSQELAFPLPILHSRDLRDRRCFPLRYQAVHRWSLCSISWYHQVPTAISDIGKADLAAVVLRLVLPAIFSCSGCITLRMLLVDERKDPLLHIRDGTLRLFGRPTFLLIFCSVIDTVSGANFSYAMWTLPGSLKH